MEKSLAIAAATAQKEKVEKSTRARMEPATHQKAVTETAWWAMAREKMIEIVAAGSAKDGSAAEAAEAAEVEPLVAAGVKRQRRD